MQRLPPTEGKAQARPGLVQSRRWCPERKAWREMAADLRGLQGADLGPRAWVSMDTLGTLVTLTVNSPSSAT